MAPPTLKADVFINAQGVAFIKAKPLPRNHAWRIHQRDNGICQLCGVKTIFGGRDVSPFSRFVSGAIDHIIPRSRGGQNEDGNLRVLCKSCNSSKGAKL